MKKELFEDLLTSIQEGAKILREEAPAYRTFTFNALDVKQIRETYLLSQGQFAALLGISVRTLRNWEQGRRVPEGPARVLLQVVAKHPEAVMDSVRSMQLQKQST